MGARMVKQCFSILVIFCLVGIVSCGGTDASSDSGVSGVDVAVEDTHRSVDVPVPVEPTDTGPPPDFPDEPNEIEFVLENKTDEVITIKMHGETITPGWFEVFHDGDSLNLFEDCSLCSCDAEIADDSCNQCPGLEPNYSEVNPGGLVSRYWPGTVFPVEQSDGSTCERQGIVPNNNLQARICWWAGPKEIAPDAEKTCVDLSFEAWKEIQVIHQVK